MTLDLDLLQRALEVEGTDQTVASKEMLLAGLPHAVACREGKETHKFQKGMLQLLESSLAAALGSVMKQQEGIKEQVAAVEESFRQAQTAESKATEATAAKREEQEAKVAAEQRAKAEVASAQVYFQELEEGKAAVLAKRSKVKGQKRAAEDRALALEKLTVSDLEDNQETGLIMDYLKELGTEEAVLVSAPHALSTRTSKRRKFDQTVVEEVNNIFTNIISGCDARLAEDAGEEEDASVEALGAWAILDVARENEVDARSAMREAGRAVRAAEEAEAAAKESVERCRSAMNQPLVQQTLLEARLKEVEAALKSVQQEDATPGAESGNQPTTSCKEHVIDGLVDRLDSPKVDATSTRNFADAANSGA